ncbi:MAG: hypothetical protein H7329_08965 [Opitutaceae bacterium]|nr:hypothetical protein [Cytophagales bacterium]
MRVIYFTYVQASQYLRFYYLPSNNIDGAIILNKGKSFVYFKTAQNNVQDTLRIIDKDIELEDCRFSYEIQDMFYYLSYPDATRICKTTTKILGKLSLIQSSTEIIKKYNSNIPIKISGVGRHNFSEKIILSTPFYSLN